MKTLLAGITLATAFAATPAAAVQLDSLKGMMGGGGSSLASGSMGNAAGIIQYCMNNNYLGGDSGAGGVKDKLLGSLSGDHAAAANDGDNASTGAMLGKLAGGGKKTDTAPTQDKGYLDGARGILKSGDGKSLNLGGAGAATSGTGDMKAQLTRKVCDAVLKQGEKMAGM